MSRFQPVSEVAELFAVDRTTVINWIKDGRLAAIKISGSYRVESASVDELIARSRISAS